MLSNDRLKLTILIFSIVLIVGIITYADEIDIHNNAFRAVIKELQNRIIVLESNSKESHIIYPQKYATGTGTSEDPWAGECLEEAYSACPIGGTIYLRAGYYQLAGVFTVSKPINIIGEGINRTIIVTATTTGFYVYNTTHVTLKGFTVDGAASEDGDPIEIAECTYIILENIEVKNGGKYGLNLHYVSHSLFHNIYSHDNDLHGIHPVADTLTWNMYNVYRDIYTHDNSGGGFCDVGNQVNQDEDLYNVYDNIHARNNTLTGIDISNQHNGIISNCSAVGNGTTGFTLYRIEDFNITNCFTIGNAHGMYFQLGDKNINVSNCTVSYNTEHGLRIESSDNINVNNCSITFNDKDGIYLKETENTIITNVTIRNNNGLSSTYDGIDIWDSNNTMITSCQSYDDREIPLQNYGVAINGDSLGISIINCKLIPNKNNSIQNSGGATITQWPLTDTDLAQLTADFNALLVRIQDASNVINE